MICVLCGLPGAGKSYLAAALQSELGCVVLDRDRIRDAVFPPEYLDYSPQQNELASRLSYQVCEYIVGRNPDQLVVLDGRPFSKRRQRDAVRELAQRLGVPIAFVLCQASNDTILRRLENVRSQISYDERADRSEEKVRHVTSEFESMSQEEHLVLNTEHAVERQVAELQAYIEAARH